MERLQFSLLPAAREPCRLISNEPEKHSFLLARSLQIWPLWRVVLIGEESECLDLVGIILFLRQVYSIGLPLGQDGNHCICSIGEMHDFSSSQQFRSSAVFRSISCLFLSKLYRSDTFICINGGCTFLHLGFNKSSIKITCNTLENFPINWPCLVGKSFI